MKRQIEEQHLGMKVFVYFNLHRKCWSIKQVSTGKVIGHSNIVELTDCIFKVSKAGRARVLREKRKNVHAGVQGILTGVEGKALRLHNAGVEVGYNPYLMETFEKVRTGEAMTYAHKVRLDAYYKKVLVQGGMG